MKLHELKAKMRSTGQKGFNTQTRLEGNVPSVLYGSDKDNLSISVERSSLEKILQSEKSIHVVLELKFEDNPEANTPVIVKEIQRHPVNSKMRHVDFLRIRLDEKIQSPVAIVLVGRSKGVVEGGIIDQQIREVIVECLPQEIPVQLDVDISDLDIGESIHVANLVVPDSVTIISESTLTIASIHAPRVVEAEVEDDEAAEDTEETESTEEA
ncbi:MAG: 50S ribosomal protein L25 [Candidatus Hydrogenedentes bacterium]|nr:50S ribosomal protein L25 [Candidatus Hydrogenedentota bacterium]